MAFLTLCKFILLAVAAPSSPLAQDIQDAAQRAHLDPKLVEAVIAAESNFNPKAVSKKGAMGLMQVMPKTADQLGIHQPHHPLDNLMGACQYLRQLINKYQGNLRLALAAYNAGPHNVERYQGIPPFKETQIYVKKVLERYHRSRLAATK